MSERNPDQLSSQIDAGVKLAVAQAIARHSRLGQSISIWRDGEVVTLSADQIEAQSRASSPSLPARA